MVFPSSLETASRRRRFACMLYEAVLLFGVLFIAGYLFDTLTHSTSGLMWRHERQAWLFSVLGVYFVWFWRHGGQTLAMKTWHVRLVDQHGGPVTWRAALMRYVLSWIFTVTGLGFLYSWMNTEGLFPQDRLTGTRLVYRNISQRSL